MVGWKKAVLTDNFLLQKCNNLLMYSTLHIYVQYVTRKLVVIEFFLTRLDQLQYHFSCSDEICLEYSVLKMHFLVEVWNDVYAGGACVLW